jgi:hypothetical protein
LVLEELLYCNGTCEPDLLQLFDSAHGRRDGEDFPSSLGESPSQFLEGDGFARARRSPNVYSPVPRVEDKLDGVPLLWPETIGCDELS